jgi:hypothetical protein
MRQLICALHMPEKKNIQQLLHIVKNHYQYMRMPQFYIMPDLRVLDYDIGTML